jgi:hypothetical protein
MSSLLEFKADLTKIIASQGDSRPFVCDGSPYECPIFIVGFNPATKTQEPFWKFWNDSTGFNKNEWFDYYKLERSKQWSKSWKRTRAVSPTRANIDHIVCGARPVKILETNVYTKPTPSQGGFPDSSEKSDVLDSLLSKIKPQLILLHGEKAREFGEKKFCCRLERGTFAKPSEYRCSIDETTVSIMSIPHLRFCKSVAAKDIGKISRQYGKQVVHKSMRCPQLTRNIRLA